jgi:hypothetical protein
MYTAGNCFRELGEGSVSSLFATQAVFLLLKILLIQQLLNTREEQEHNTWAGFMKRLAQKQRPYTHSETRYLFEMEIL